MKNYKNNRFNSFIELLDKYKKLQSELDLYKRSFELAKKDSDLKRYQMDKYLNQAREERT